MTKKLFGATVAHTRDPFTDAATDSRSISIKTKLNPDRRPDSFHEIGEDDPKVAEARTILERVVPDIPVDAKMPPHITVLARLWDTWKPILSLAQYCDDNEYLEKIYRDLESDSKALQDAAAYEPAPLVLQGLVAALTVSYGIDGEDCLKFRSDNPRR